MFVVKWVMTYPCYVILKWRERSLCANRESSKVYSWVQKKPIEKQYMQDEPICVRIERICIYVSFTCRHKCLCVYSLGRIVLTLIKGITYQYQKWKWWVGNRKEGLRTVNVFIIFIMSMCYYFNSNTIIDAFEDYFYFCFFRRFILF